MATKYQEEVELLNFRHQAIQDKGENIHNAVTSFIEKKDTSRLKNVFRLFIKLYGLAGMQLLLDEIEKFQKTATLEINESDKELLEKQLHIWLNITTSQEASVDWKPTDQELEKMLTQYLQNDKGMTSLLGIYVHNLLNKDKTIDVLAVFIADILPIVKRMRIDNRDKNVLIEKIEKYGHIFINAAYQVRYEW